jgi:hypothetical protein
VIAVWIVTDVIKVLVWGFSGMFRDDIEKEKRYRLERRRLEECTRPCSN